ncbi:hypothetical protein DL766_000794 [Monosporascus sp. MC13-8B]|uniref:AA1-like domain-containing protein n=1 Tax=Monosporascus cannonballus TaxID=155416 RepID=A0ABY0HHW1_9PEZI|nr:hypothetical protein DL762_001103 [Monosporascus cannonballus]RYO98380.1 hypothetical protein DL763_002219 [Monosporascus cannonballus]RYP38794.1 hypothetical protein DL766_000794 [Monosporascus sp. MC13-8B]
MKFAAVATLFSLASAASMQKKQVQEYKVLDFTASCIPHSVNCVYDFKVNHDPVFTPDECKATVQGPDSLPSVKEGKCPDNLSYTWSIDRTEEGGLDFKIWYAFNSRSNITYCHSIPASDITSEPHGAVTTERYTGPSEFPATIFDC